jgi:hypothetical protein
MDKATFHVEIEKIVAEYRLDEHPYVKLVNHGRAAQEQLTGYPIQHYEMTVRDSAPLSAMAYLNMYEIDQIDQNVAHGSAKGFAEEALGLYSHSAGHTELLGLCEEIDVEAYKMLQEGLERHYGLTTSESDRRHRR